jgi:hypothetical protein
VGASCAGVSHQQSAPDGTRERLSQDLVALVNGRRRQLLRELVDPLLDGLVLEPSQGHITERREDLRPDVDLVPGERAGPESLPL